MAVESDHIADPVISGFRFRCFDLPQSRMLGDSQISSNMYWLGALELFDADGGSGLGFVHGVMDVTPEEASLSDWFAKAIMPGLAGKDVPGLLNRVRVPRGGHRSPVPFRFDEAVDQALWDLAAKRAGLPLFKYLGGTDATVDAYASGLCFHLSPSELEAFYAQAVADGYTRFKVKVGHRDRRVDLERLKIVSSVIGPNATLMIDANEAWTATECIGQVRSYEDAGIPIYWIEDPVLRRDYAGLGAIRAALPHIHVNGGEYLSPADKLSLIESRAADIINIHGHISHALRLAWVAGEAGLSISLGNTAMNLGVHIASAIASPFPVENSYFNVGGLFEARIPATGGQYVIPDRPGHGLVLAL